MDFLDFGHHVIDMYETCRYHRRRLSPTLDIQYIEDGRGRVRSGLTEKECFRFKIEENEKIEGVLLLCPGIDTMHSAVVYGDTTS